jgi:hypothetical protein
MELTTNQKPLKQCIVLMKMNGMVVQPTTLKKHIMSTPKIIKKDPYAALRYRSLIILLLLRFAMYLLGPCNYCY